MNPFDFPPLAALLEGAYSALWGLTTVFTPLLGGAAAAAAIVVTTLVVRTLLIPVGVATARAEQMRARLAPRLRALQQRHRSDPERLRRETLRLYQEEGASPAAGCVPILLQAPLVGLLYAVFLHPQIGEGANELLSQTVFGVPLGTGFVAQLTHGGLDLSSAAVLGGVVLAIAAVGELTRRLLRPPASALPPATPNAGPAPTPDPALLPALLGVLQFGTAIAALFVPLAAGIYLWVTVTWTLVQRLVLRRRFPLEIR